FITLLGPSGCGKTTTLRMIAGFIPPSSGKIFIGGKAVSDHAQAIFVPPEKRHIGMVFQSYAVWPHMNVIENVAYPLKIQKVPKAERHRQAENVLELVRLGGMGKRYPNQLSGGQQQRVALARALIMQPQVMLLDEPLSNLDAKLREEMRFEIQDLQKRTGVTIVYVTHDQAEAMAMSDRIVVMNQGKIHQIGTAQTIYQQPADQFVADFVGLINFIPCKKDREAGGVILAIDGHEILYETPLPENIQTKAVLAVRPENIMLETLAAPQSKMLTGTVERTTYLGNLTDYLIKIGSYAVRVQQSGGSRFHPGDEVQVQIATATVFSEQKSDDYLTKT
ncbi:polyamine ABC transporter ATP-binding protein, partial [candidate division KSB3 bacterium]|nr:polyamine ABC transporter ATP-binding protein [candidate division KSB3 bacterium]